MPAVQAVDVPLPPARLPNCVCPHRHALDGWVHADRITRYSCVQLPMATFYSCMQQGFMLVHGSEGAASNCRPQMQACKLTATALTASPPEPGKTGRGKRGNPREKEGKWGEMGINGGM